MTITGMAEKRTVTFRFPKLRRVIVNSDAVIALLTADTPDEYLVVAVPARTMRMAVADFFFGCIPDRHDFDFEGKCLTR